MITFTPPVFSHSHPPPSSLALPRPCPVPLLPRPLCSLDFVAFNVWRSRSSFVFSVDCGPSPRVPVSGCFFLSVYAGWVVAVVSRVRSRSNYDWAAWWATAFGTLFVALFWVFHSLQYIDYDWRYRLPCLPALILLGAIGWNEILNLLRARSRSRSQPTARAV